MCLLLLNTCRNFSRVLYQRWSHFGYTLLSFTSLSLANVAVLPDAVTGTVSELPLFPIFSIRPCYLVWPDDNIFVNSMAVKRYFLGLIWIYPIMRLSLISYLLAIWIFSSVICLCLFFYWIVLSFCYVEILYILNTNPLLVICISSVLLAFLLLFIQVILYRTF